MTPARARWPWTDADVLRLCVASAVGLIAIVATWYWISGSANTGTQALWLNIGVAGVVISALGNGVWLLRGRRAVGERRAELVSLQAVETPAELAPDPARSSASSTTTLGLVRAVGMTHVHVEECPLVAGKAVQPAALGEGDPCGVCLP